MGGEEKREVRVRGAAGRCPYCHDLITDVRELVACAGCGARQHERCYQEHGTCSSCGGTDVLVSRTQSKGKQSLRPPKGSSIHVDEREGEAAYTWDTKKGSQLAVVSLLLTLCGFTIPLLPVIWIWWLAEGERKTRVLVHDDGLDLKLEPPFRGVRTVFAKREDVGAIRLTRTLSLLKLTIDVGVDRIQLAVAGPPTQGFCVPLKEPEVEWLYERLVAWKAEA